MENWEDKNLRVHTPDSIIESHRDGLRSKLGKMPPRRHSAVKRSALVMTLILVVGLSGLTAAYPGWAEDLYQTVIVRNFTLHLKDGGEIKIRTIQAECEPGSAVCDSLFAGIAGMEATEGKVFKKVITFDEGEIPAEQKMRIDAEISEFAGQVNKDGEQTITIEAVDCGDTWIVNGEEVKAEETIVPINSAADILADIERESAETIDEEAPIAATTFELGQNYPNPFNPTTQIPFDLKESGNVTLKVYNLMGQEIATLVNGYQNAGTHTVTFNGAGLPSGVYVYALEAGDYQFSRQMTLTK
ncbi:T9SS type A sorting domain-containing protein [bacterium]|nr:T9SS type A sorting domain-containing protein [bacterium]